MENSSYVNNVTLVFSKEEKYKKKKTNSVWLIEHRKKNTCIPETESLKYMEHKMTLLRECIELFCLSLTSVRCLLPSQGVSQ